MVKTILLYLALLSGFSAFAKPVLTVYTYDSFAAEWGPGPKVKQAFEQQCDCELKFVALEDGVSLLNRVRLEGKNSKADVVLGLDNNLLEAARNTGLFTSAGINSDQLKMPKSWNDPVFIPYDYGYFAFVYNKSKLPHPPASLKELVESDKAWRIIYQDPRTSTPGLGLLLWMNKVFPHETAQAWRKLATKTVTVTKGWSEAYNLFLKGESDMVLSYTSSPAYHLIEEKNHNYAAVSFSEGHYLQVEIAARLAASKQPQLAQQFLQFMLSAAFQQLIPQGNWMYPVTDIPLPDGFNQMITPDKTLEFSSQQVDAQRSQWVNEWLRAVSH